MSSQICMQIGCYHLHWSKSVIFDIWIGVGGDFKTVTVRSRTWRTSWPVRGRRSSCRDPNVDPPLFFNFLHSLSLSPRLFGAPTLEEVVPNVNPVRRFGTFHSFRSGSVWVGSWCATKLSTSCSRCLRRNRSRRSTFLSFASGDLTRSCCCCLFVRLRWTRMWW